MIRIERQKHVSPTLHFLVIRRLLFGDLETCTVRPYLTLVQWVSPPDHKGPTSITTLWGIAIRWEMQEKAAVVNQILLILVCQRIPGPTT